MSNNKRYYKNEFYFEEIDTKAKAYILGFSLADGYNRRYEGTKTIDGKRKTQDFSIRYNLQVRDKSILDFIASEIFVDRIPEMRIRDDINKVYLNISSKQISNDLAKWGMVSGRMPILKYPNINEEFDIDFIRGYFDGNGSVGTYKYSHQTVYNFNIVGGEIFLLSIKQKLEKAAKIKLRIREKKEDNVWVLYSRSKKEIKKIYKVLYKNVSKGMFLERKEEKMRLIK